MCVTLLAQLQLSSCLPLQGNHTMRLVSGCMQPMPMTLMVWHIAHDVPFHPPTSSATRVGSRMPHTTAYQGGPNFFCCCSKCKPSIPKVSRHSPLSVQPVSGPPSAMRLPP